MKVENPPCHVPVVDRLAAIGLSRARLLAEVDDVFGVPELAVATGSVVAGFANERSDVDVYVVVDNDDVAMLPVVSYVDNARVEVVLHSASRLRRRAVELGASPWPPLADADRDGRQARRRSIDSLTRFVIGDVLLMTGSWDDWLDDVAENTYEWVFEWYRSEAVRAAIAARWLEATNPRLAGIRWCDAILAGLELVTLTAGETYFKPKWLGEKLLRSVPEELPTFRRALTLGLSEHGDFGWARNTYERLVPASPTNWRAILRLAPGSELHEPSRTVHRWRLRWSDAAVDIDADGVVWTGPVDVEPPGEVMNLFRRDFLWLGLCQEAV